MAEPSEYLEKLACEARRESAPRRDVSAQVLRRVAASKDREIARPVYAFALGSLLVCAAAVVLFWSLSSGSTDPLADFFQNGASFAALGWS